MILPSDPEAGFIQNKIVLVTGASGFVGEHLARFLVKSGAVVIGTFFTNDANIEKASLIPVDLRDGRAVGRLLRDLKPEFIFHCAGITRFGFCEEEPESARAGIVEITRNLIEARAAHVPDSRLITLSTDMVYDGGKSGWTESDEARPGSVYGQMKLEADRLVLDSGAGTVLRPALIYGPEGSFISWMFESLMQEEKLNLFADEFRTPVLVDDLIHAMILSAGQKRSAIPAVIHVGGSNRLNRVEMGGILLEKLNEKFALDLSPELIVPGLSTDSPSTSNRPKDLSLDSSLLHQTFGLQTQSFEAGIDLILQQLFSVTDQ